MRIRNLLHGVLAGMAIIGISMLVISQVSKPSTSAATYMACRPVAGSTQPTQLVLTSAHTGLTQLIEQPVSYQIYGSSPSDLEQQITDCAPKTTDANRAEFTAETSYRLSWQYDFLSQADGTCSLSNIKLGLHTTMVLPDWIVSSQAQAGLPAQWQAFMTNLRTHEDGHVALDVQHSQALLATLQTLPSTSCDTIVADTTTVINQAVNDLNQANDAYDTVTSHGATQGAILP